MKITVTARNRLILALGISGVVLGTLTTVEPILGGIGAVLAIIVLCYQHRTAGAIVVPFTAQDWRRRDNGYVLVVPRSRHGKRKPSATVWIPTDDGGYEEVCCDIHTTANDDVSIGVNMPNVEGEVRIS